MVFVSEVCVTPVIEIEVSKDRALEGIFTCAFEEFVVMEPPDELIFVPVELVASQLFVESAGQISQTSPPFAESLFN